jgi:hypothetical protein
MKTLLNALLALALLSLGAARTAHAHEGHPHDTSDAKSAPSKPQSSKTAGQGHAAGSKDHPHDAPHGGSVQSTSKGHLELVAGRDGTFKLYVLDEKLVTLSVAGASATLKLTVPGYADVKLSPVGDHLEGKGAAFQAEHPTAVISVTTGGVTQTARFTLHLEGSAQGGSHGGMAQSHGGAEASARPGFRAELKTTPSTVKAGQPVTLTFSVKDAKGTLVRELPQVHEKPMHLLAISRDLAEFAHLHPEPQPDGTYQVRHTFPSGGAYKLYADYTPSGSPQVVDQIELTVEGPSRPAARLKEDATPTKTVEGVRVTMSTAQPLRAGSEALLRFAVADAKTGKPVTDLQPYLGALAHFVILSEDTKDFLHAHPLEAQEPSGGTMAGHADKQGAPGGKSPSEVSAHTSFPRPGLYKVWTQLQRGGRVITVPFVVRVAEATGQAPTHSGHGAQGAMTPVPANAIPVKVSSAGFEPSRVSVRSGKPVTLAFQRTDAKNCGNKVVFPALGIERELPVGQTVMVTLEPPKTGELAFTCGMAMYRGAIVVQ